jgi:hypothetical protein
MSFATKILFKIFKIEELHGHNVSGKTLNKNLKAKLPLDTVRIGYIKFLVEKYYDEKECKEMLSGLASHKQDLWKSCHTAINKSILISERKSAAALVSGATSSELAASSSSNGITQLTNAIELLNESDLNKTLDDDDDDEDESDDDSDDELDDLSSGDESSEDFDISKKIKATANKKKLITSSIKQTNIATTQRRRSDRIKKPNQKFSELDDTEDEENDDDDDDEYKFTDENGSNARVKEEDEVELIQNIENRQKQSIKNNQTTRNVQPKSTSTITSTTNSSSSKQPLTIISPPPSQQQQTTPSNRTKRRNQQTKQDQESSSEASAAANIAAAMKKRFVVIATTNQKTSSN